MLSFDFNNQMVVDFRKLSCVLNQGSRIMNDLSWCVQNTNTLEPRQHAHHKKTTKPEHVNRGRPHNVKRSHKPNRRVINKLILQALVGKYHFDVKKMIMMLFHLGADDELTTATVTIAIRKNHLKVFRPDVGDYVGEYSQHQSQKPTWFVKNVLTPAVLGFGNTNRKSLGLLIGLGLKVLLITDEDARLTKAVLNITNNHFKNPANVALALKLSVKYRHEDKQKEGGDNNE